MNLDDPVVRFLGQVILVIILLMLGTIAMFTLAVAVDFIVLTKSQGPANSTLNNLLAFLPALSGPSVKETYNILAIIITAIPLILTAVCFKPGPPQNATTRNTIDTVQQPARMQRLNWVGTVAAVLLLLTGIASLIAYLMISPANWAGYLNGSDAGILLQDWSKTTLRNSVFYFSALLGMKATS